MIELFLVSFGALIIYTIMCKVYKSVKDENKRDLEKMQEERKAYFAYREKIFREQQAKKKHVNIMF